MYRKSTPEDVRAVYALICDMEEKQLPFDRFQRIYEQQLEDSRYYCLVYETGDAVAGVLNLRFEEQLHHGEAIAEILEFSVAPSHRSQGIGRGMFAQACRLAKGAGCVQLEVDCNQLRVDTHRFYRREGMREFHYKFSKVLVGADRAENAIGR